MACRGTFYSGEKSPTWTGGTWHERRTYPNLGKTAGGDGSKAHRFQMVAYLRRALKKREVVHHIDGDTGNNSIKNLFLFHCARCHLHFHKNKTVPLRYKYRDFHARLDAKRKR